MGSFAFMFKMWTCRLLWFISY